MQPLNDYLVSFFMEERLNYVLKTLDSQDTTIFLRFTLLFF